MSADNYGYCPKCALLYKDVDEKLFYKLMENNLREVWGIGLSVKGLFSIDYFSECTKCGYAFVYKHNEQVKVE